jgi:hypothetical protein
MELVGVDMAAILELVEEALKGNRKPAAIQALISFASGKDGKLGTIDDRMTPATLDMLKKMINDGSIDLLVEKMHKAGVFERLFRCCGV